MNIKELDMYCYLNDITKETARGNDITLFSLRTRRARRWESWLVILTAGEVSRISKASLDETIFAAQLAHTFTKPLR